MQAPERFGPSPALAFTRWQRRAALVLHALAAANLLVLSTRLLVDGEDGAPLPWLVRRLFFFSLLPGLLLLVLRDLARATVRIEAGTAFVDARDASYEVPLAAVRAVLPRRFPRPGFWLSLASGATFERFLAPEAALQAARALGHEPPLLEDGDAARRLRRLHWWPIKYALLGLLLTLVLFRLNQLIAWGGLFGEWQSLGLLRWLKTLLGVALWVLSRLLLFAAPIRALVELVALGTARLPAAWARRARVTLEVLAALAYYGTIAAALVLRFRD